MLMIEVEALAKYFGRFSALRNLCIRINRGDFIALFGRNGAGKTTLLRILAGLSRPSAGRITIHASRSLSPRHARGIMGYLSHATALYSDLTALENLRFFAQLQDLPCDDATLQKNIERVGLAGRDRDPVRNYSRGMQQRLAIARAFLHDPALLLLDEPFTGLDQAGMDYLKKWLEDAREQGKTCVMALHDPALGFEIANRLVVIERGVVALDLLRDSITLAEFQEKFRALSKEH
jgi:heme exporter protein A